MVGLPVRSGRICLGRQREAVGPGACSEVAVVVGFETAAWVWRHDQSPPPLGRLCWHATSTLDARGRVVLSPSPRVPRRGKPLA